ncbi:hypothetical protein DL96DRAFT_1579529 [Flagelloscypha sp. PMI_526]|nr:hypothetical protein DL96DRAFT_1579529 [Flagelloscypha sp. PMI_526]
MYEPKGVRRTHVKSRNGCTTCKSRRIKCDEQRPICVNCSKKDLVCVFGPRQGPPSNSDVNHKPQSASPPSTSSDDLHLYPSSPTIGSTGSPVTQDLSALELIHHYTTSTAVTLPCYYLRPGILTTIAPKRALQLKESITPNYFDLSRRHYRQSITLLREAMSDSLSPSTDRNEAMAWTKNMLSIYVIGSPAPESKNASVEERWASTTSFFEWLPTARSLGATNTNYWTKTIALHGDLETFEEVSRHILNPPPPEWLATRLAFPDTLNNIHLPSANTPDRAEVEDIYASEIYRQAVEKLLDTWALSLRPTHQLASVLAWLVLVPQGFIQYVLEKRPRALVIMAFYFALISQYDDTWWIRSRGVNEIQTISTLLTQSSQSEWLPWIGQALLAVQQMKETVQSHVQEHSVQSCTSVVYNPFN